MDHLLVDGVGTRGKKERERGNGSIEKSPKKKRRILRILTRFQHPVSGSNLLDRLRRRGAGASLIGGKDVSTKEYWTS